MALDQIEQLTRQRFGARRRHRAASGPRASHRSNAGLPRHRPEPRAPRDARRNRPARRLGVHRTVNLLHQNGRRRAAPVEAVSTTGCRVWLLSPRSPAASARSSARAAAPARWLRSVSAPSRRHARPESGRPPRGVPGSTPSSAWLHPLAEPRRARPEPASTSSADQPLPQREQGRMRFVVAIVARFEDGAEQVRRQIRHQAPRRRSPLTTCREDSRARIAPSHIRDRAGFSHTSPASRSRAGLPGPGVRHGEGGFAFCATCRRPRCPSARHPARRRRPCCTPSPTRAGEGEQAITGPRSCSSPWSVLLARFVAASSPSSIRRRIASDSVAIRFANRKSSTAFARSDGSETIFRADMVRGRPIPGR